ncbi:MAG: SDR family oxidoreductase [Dysgonamonadaceae bacterium]|jgi:NAD(P)-dependent dehydrogenase (short-subunit alcohol dehydrogenase family)|nr:SDR family oxidoreductase [Dysgonamonadaceae bacterium]
MYNPFSLEGKTILVTGASSGIGRATAVECAKMGAKVVITGRNAERLQETFDNLEGDGHTQIIADLSDKQQLQYTVDQTPTIDGIVNNAGIGKTLLFKFIDREDFNEIMQINFFAPVFLTQLLLKTKKLQKDSSVVFISSISTFAVGVGDSMYAASKGAINAFVKTLAVELAKQRIRVNYIQPGIVETHIFDSGVIDDEQLKETELKYPLGRFGQPKEIAHAAIYFLSEASKWTTGTGLVVDGGFTLL